MMPLLSRSFRYGGHRGDGQGTAHDLPPSRCRMYSSSVMRARLPSRVAGRLGTADVTARTSTRPMWMRIVGSDETAMLSARAVARVWAGTMLSLPRGLTGRRARPSPVPGESARAGSGCERGLQTPGPNVHGRLHRSDGRVRSRRGSAIVSGISQG